MSNPNAPVKTPLGHQELRQRTQGLGQRYRTVLLLVDGRRTVAEVLTMAQQAGAQTAHFEELVRLGLVELPAPPPPPPLPPEPPADVVQTAEVELESEPVIEAEVLVAPAISEAPGFEPAPPAVQPVAAVPRTEPAPAAPPVARAEPVVAVDMAVAERKLDDVRRLLIDILRRDTLLQRVFAPARVRGAQTQEELIGLVWEIERERAHARRKRGQLINLQRARELLGMGNTVVAEDSLPTPPEG